MSKSGRGHKAEDVRSANAASIQPIGLILWGLDLPAAISHERGRLRRMAPT